MSARLRSPFCCLFLLVIVNSCGGTQTSENTEKTAKNVEVSKSVSAGAPTTLAISAGSATGTEIIVEDGALAEGSTLSLDRVEQPSEFAEFTSENGDGETSFSEASSAIQVTGSAELVSPMTIAIPYSGTTSLKFFLLGVARIADNICVAHKTNAGELFFFKGELLKIATSEEKVKFKSSTYGVYQLFFCGANTPGGLADAGAGGISGPPPGSDPSKFSSYGKEAEFKLSIDSSRYGYGASKYCVIIASDKSSEEAWSFQVIAAGEFAINGGVSEAKIAVNTAEIGDESSVQIGVLLQSSSQNCAFTPGDEINASNQVNYDRSFRFQTTKKQVHEGTASGTLGSGIYALSSQTIKIGSPLAGYPTRAFAVSQVCVAGVAYDSQGATLASALLNTQITGADTISLEVPSGSTGFSGINLEVSINNSCEQESFNYTDSYAVTLKNTHSDGVYYLAPVNLGVPEQVETQLAALSDKNVCAEIYDGNYTSSSVAQSDSSKSLGRWALLEGDLSVYLPFSSEKMQSDTPIFDILYHLGSNCRSGFPADITIVTNDENLFD